MRVYFAATIESARQEGVVRAYLRVIVRKPHAMIAVFTTSIWIDDVRCCAICVVHQGWVVKEGNPTIFNSGVNMLMVQCFR